MRFEEPTGEVKSLVDRFLDDTLSDEEMQQLDRLLNDSASLRAFFSTYCQMHIELGTEEAVDLRAQKVFDEFCERKQKLAAAPFPVLDTSAADNPLSYLMGAAGRGLTFLVCRPAMIFLLGLLTAVVAYEVWPRAAERQQQSVNANPNTSVAYLASVNGCSWVGSPVLHAVGSDVRAGEELFLEEGIAEFRLANGVIASIEGPASMLLGTSSTLILQHGKLTVRVPWGVKDFGVIAGDCRVVATDAEIGVVVAKGSVEVHSFAGESRLAPLQYSESLLGAAGIEDGVDEDDDDVETFFPLLVAEGRAGVWHSTGNYQTENLLADRSKFASKLSMGGNLPATQQYAKAVLASKPVSYWRFESIENRRIANEVSGGQALAIIGEVDLSGDHQNHFLELGSTPDSGHLVTDSAVPLAGKDYTLEVWCKPSHYHRGTLVALGLEPPRKPNEEILKHAVILQTMRDDDRYADVLRNLNPGGIRFLHRNPPTRDPRTGTSCYTTRRYQVRRWQHVVAVKKDGAIRVYVDGVVTGKADDSTEIAKGLRVMVGKAILRRQGSLPPRSFCGQLDELAIYNRALSEEEIDSHFKAIDFKEQQKALSEGNPDAEQRAKTSVHHQNVDAMKHGV